MKLAFDISQMKPACVLVAAGMGADPQLSQRFHTDTWLLAPTPKMRVYEINEHQLNHLVKLVEMKHEIAG